MVVMVRRSLSASCCLLALLDAAQLVVVAPLRLGVLLVGWLQPWWFPLW